MNIKKLRRKIKKQTNLIVNMKNFKTFVYKDRLWCAGHNDPVVSWNIDFRETEADAEIDKAFDEVVRYMRWKETHVDVRGEGESWDGWFEYWGDDMFDFVFKYLSKVESEL